MSSSETIFHHLLARVQRLHHGLAERTLLHGRGELLDHLEVDVGLEQRETHLAHRLVHVILGQLAARANVAEGGLGESERASNIRSLR